MFNKSALYGSRRAKLVLRASVEGIWLRLEVASAELAVSAHGELVNAFDRGVLQHAMSRALSALYTLIGIKLPDPIVRLTAGDQYTHCAAQSQ